MSGGTHRPLARALRETHRQRQCQRPARRLVIQQVIEEVIGDKACDSRDYMVTEGGLVMIEQLIGDKT